MNRRMALLSVAVFALAAASCSAGYSKPQAENLAQVDDGVWAFIDTDPHPNTKTTIAQIQSTSDGLAWEPVLRESGRVGVVPGLDVDQECDVATGICFRIGTPHGGISLERSADSGASWDEVWGITSGRLDFQNRCCGTRGFAIHDLEYVAETGLVAASLGEYGLLTLGLDEEVHLDALGRYVRPESSLMVGLYMEPIFVGALALILGWIINEQGLHRLRLELEARLGSAEHTWVTSRARQVPILLPLVFFLGMAGAVAVVARSIQSVERDSPQVTGWVPLVVAITVIVAASFGRHWLHRRRWQADDETRARIPFAGAAGKAARADTMGTAATLMTFVAAMVPLTFWTTGTIDEFGDSVQIGLLASVLIAIGFWIWEMTRPALPE